MSLLSTFSLVWGVLAILGMAVGIIPFLGSLNYLNIPFAVFGLLFSILVIVYIIKKGTRRCGSLLCAAAIFIGSIRLVLGFGIF